MRDRERSKESFSRRKMDGGSIPTGPSSTGRTLPRPPPINKRQVAVVSQNTDAIVLGMQYCNIIAFLITSMELGSVKDEIVFPWLSLSAL